MANAAHRSGMANRPDLSRAEAKRAAAKKVAAQTGGATPPGSRKLPSTRRRLLRRIDAELPDPAVRDPEPPGATLAPDARPPRQGFSPRPLKALHATAPLLAIVGRPNVGKSSLFNRLTGSRRSIVGDEPGITRDRIYGEIDWLGKRIRVVDTGGILPQSQELIPAEILRQARFALDEAAFIIMVVDGRAPLTAPDYELARLLFQGGKPVLLAVNKLDTQQMNDHLGEYRRLGIRDILPVSSEHGMGIGDLLDHVFSALDLSSAETASGRIADKDATDDREGADYQRTHGKYRQHEISVAIIGRPNVGKSTLLNALTGSSRAIVSPIAGTTRDAVDEVIEYDGAQLRFVDTAGIRRKGKTREMAEKLSVVMARRHLEAADVALLIIDATEGVTSADATIGGYAHESGRSVILVVNKWDLVTTARGDGKPPADQAIFERQLRSVLKYLSYAPVVFIAASEGRNISRVLKLVREVAAERRKRVSTGQMNRFLEQVDFERAAVPMANKMKIFYMTQAAVAPPTFILFTNRQAKLHFSFERFLENQIRAAFGFRGSPIWFKVRARSHKNAQ